MLVCSCGGAASDKLFSKQAEKSGSFVAMKRSAAQQLIWQPVERLTSNTKQTYKV